MDWVQGQSDDSLTAAVYWLTQAANGRCAEAYLELGVAYVTSRAQLFRCRQSGCNA